MHGSFTSGMILKSNHETERNFKNVQSDSVRGGRDTSRVAITIVVDRIDVLEIGGIQMMDSWLLHGLATSYHCPVVVTCCN